MRGALTVVRRHWRELTLVLVYLLPTLALLGFGLAWLWQNGAMPAFVVVALVLTVGHAVVVRLFPRDDAVPTLRQPGSGAPKAEQDARAALSDLAAALRATPVSSIEDAVAVSRRAIETVAAAYHPDDARAALNVTLPEILLLGEDVSRRLLGMIRRDLPVLEGVQIGLLMRGVDAGGWAVRGWGLVRLGQLVANPMQALVSEARGALLGRAIDRLTGEAKARLTGALVEEIGEVAIRLYAGEYRRRADVPPEAGTPAPAPAGPLTILVAGQVNAGKSSLINALAGEMRVPAGQTGSTDRFFTVTIEAEDPAIGSLVLVDSPGLSGPPDEDWLRHARAADLVIWTAAANRADRAVDQAALRGLRAMAAADPHLRELPIVLAVTHADRLDPPLEWTPPYDPEGERPKERTMRAALSAVTGGLGFRPDQAALVAVPEAGARPWNLPALWERIGRNVSAAKQKQLERGLRAGGWLRVARDLPASLAGGIRRAVDLLNR